MLAIIIEHKRDFIVFFGFRVEVSRGDIRAKPHVLSPRNLVIANRILLKDDGDGLTGQCLRKFYLGITRQFYPNPIGV